jgi:hypothetical protein
MSEIIDVLKIFFAAFIVVFFTTPIDGHCATMFIRFLQWIKGTKE